MCGGDKKKQKKVDAPLADPVNEGLPPPLVEEPKEAPAPQPTPPSVEEWNEPKGAGSMSKMTDTSIAKGTQSIGFQTIRGKGTGVAQGPAGADKSMTSGGSQSIALMSQGRPEPKGNVSGAFRNKLAGGKVAKK